MTNLDELNENDIAIVGMGMRVPGAASVSEFWSNLLEGKESVQFFSQQELLTGGEDADRIQQANYVPAGAPLDKMEYFDGDFFGFSPKESAILDPQHRHFLECSWEALEDAGHVPERFDGQIGVFAGCGMGSYFYFNLCSNKDLVDSVGMFLLRHTGNDKDFLATRLSFLLDLRGPSVNVQTACSTSLVATHMACQSLLSGECDMALAGGVTIELPHRRGYLYQENEILSPDGHCHAFDARAQGTIFGSGVGVVVLRRVKDAIESGDQIYALLKGTAVNNDGSTKAGYLAPSVDGQAAAITEALAIADVPAESIGYVECHGTGTYLGDPIEISALSLAHRQTTEEKQYCRVGSVKSNIGHLDTAAGVVGLIKASMAVRDGVIPPTLNYSSPNPNIDFESSPFKVNDQRYEWNSDNTPRRAGINSLGVGGTNAHAIIEEPPELPETSSAEGWQLIALSAKDRNALEEMTETLAQFLESNPSTNLADVSYTLLEGRREFTHRRVIVARDAASAANTLRSKDPRQVFTQSAASEAPEIVFLFPGGGAQYANMARGLYEAEPVFRKHLDEGLAIIAKQVPFDPKAVLFPAAAQTEQAEQELRKPSVQLPLLFIVEYSLAQLLLSKGIKPKALLGHSMGENTAACLSGVFTYAEGIGLVVLRGRLFDSVPAGGMLSVTLSEAELKKRLPSDLDLACVNAPELCVVSGPSEPLDAFKQTLETDEIEAKSIPIDIAAHSRMLEPILAEFGAYLRSLSLKAPSIPFLSNRTGTWITDEQAMDPDYWVAHLRRTVNFGDCVTEAAKSGPVMLEVGPGNVLGSLAKASPKVSAQNVVASLRHPKDQLQDEAFLVLLQGRLWGCGIPLDLDNWWKGQTRRRISLPTYRFQREPYWIEAGKSSAGSTQSRITPHRTPELSKWFYQPVWRRHDLSEAPVEETSNWLVFADEDGLADALISDLKSAGSEVIVVRAGDTYHKVNDSEYVLAAEHGRRAYEALIRDLVAAGKTPKRLLHCWQWATEERFRPGSTFFHRNLESGFYSLMFLAQALASEEYPNPLHMVVCTMGAQQVGSEKLPFPEQATSLGPCKVIPQEFPGITVSCVDLPVQFLPSGSTGFGQQRKSIVEELSELTGLGELREQLHWSQPPADNHFDQTLLLRELHAEPHNRVVALRGSQRWVLEYERTGQPQKQVPLKQQGVYLLTGGFGGIGLSIAKHLAKEYKAKLALLARQPLPPREDWDQWLTDHPGDVLSERIREVRALEAEGASVLTLGVDVTDFEGVSDALKDIKEHLGPLNGVFHGAGAVNDGPILARGESDVEATFAAKVYGTRVLSEALEKEPLDFLLLFSSTSTAIAAAGQVDYVGANWYLNAHACAMASEGFPAVAINWGIWAETGMAVEAATQAGLIAEQETELKPQHPWWESVSRRKGGATLTMRASTKQHWVLDEHRTINGNAVMPGTGYVELIVSGLAELGEASSFEIQNLYFFRPLHVRDDEDKVIRLMLERTERGYQAEVQSLALVDHRGQGWERHAQAEIAMRQLPDAESQDLRVIATRCDFKLTPLDASKNESHHSLVSPQEEFLRFGKRWRVLRRMGLGNGEAIAELSLDPQFQEDLEYVRIHPALLDLATGYAMSLVKDYDSSERSLWVPVSYKGIKFREALPREITSWVKAHPGASVQSGFASFDVVISDREGKPLVEVDSLTIKRVSDPDFVPKAPAENELARDESSTRELSLQERAFAHNLKQGIRPVEGVQLLESVLSPGCPNPVIVSSMDLADLIAQAGQLSEDHSQSTTTFSRPQLESAYLEPRNDIERTLVEVWQDLLGVDKIGVQDSFFDLGGHSLIAVRLFSKLKKLYQVDYPISVLFEAPTVEACAKLIQEELGDALSGPAESTAKEVDRSRYQFLVPMHAKDAPGETPFFLVAGMFGNVLNLRQLANVIGTGRPFYGVQARGLFGEQKPHDSFEEMARDYLAEIRQVQPHGPYLIGGYSGGGVVAYEIARQLLEASEEVPLLVMLDTPIPQDEPLSNQEKALIHLQRFQRDGAAYPMNWVRGKLEYARKMQASAKELSAQTDTNASTQEFHSRSIEAAFYKALDNYKVQNLPVTISLFRPKLRPTHEFGEGRMINKDRRRIYHDNGWSRYVEKVDVVEVPGGHDSMVLEPNVRVLGAKLEPLLTRLTK